MKVSQLVLLLFGVGSVATDVTLDHKYKITSNGKGKGYYFGWSIAASNGGLVVGAPDDESFTGVATAYTRISSTTIETHGVKLRPDFTSKLGVQFGQSVSSNEKHIVVGTFHQPPLRLGRSNTMGNFIYVHDVHTPHTFRAKLPAGRVGIDQVEISDDNTIVCSCGGYGGSMGVVRVYGYKSSTWSHSQSIASPDFDYSLSVGLSSSHLVVGVPYANNEAGLVHLYTKKSGTEEWVLKEKLRPLQDPGSYFGGSLSLHGNRLAVAAAGKKAVFVYTYHPQSGSWVVRKGDTLQNENFAPLYYQMGVAVEGSKVAVVTKGVGVSVVYDDKHSGIWDKVHVLKAKGESVEENHSKCVVINGGLVFTSRADRSRELPGAVYVHDISE